MNNTLKLILLIILCVLTLLYSPFALSKKEKNVIYIGNGVGLKFGGFEARRASLEKDMINAGVWRAESSIIHSHYSCIKPSLEGDIDVVTDVKKTNKQIKKLNKERSNFQAFFYKATSKAKPRAYFLKARFISEISREILENIDWKKQSLNSLSTLRGLRACYFLYHGALNSLNSIEKSYTLTKYEENQRRLKLKAVGFNDNLSELGSALLSKSKKGDKRREKDPVIFHNIKLFKDLKSNIKKKGINQTIRSAERMSDYEEACLCIKEHHSNSGFCNKSDSLGLSKYVEIIKPMTAYIQDAALTSGNINIEKNINTQNGYSYIKQNKKELNNLNRTLYKSLRKELASLSRQQNTEALMCVTDLLTDNTQKFK